MQRPIWPRSPTPWVKVTPEMCISGSDSLWSFSQAISCIGFQCEIQAHMSCGDVRGVILSSARWLLQQVQSGNDSLLSNKESGQVCFHLWWLMQRKTLSLNIESCTTLVPLSEIKLQWCHPPHLQDIWRLKFQQFFPPPLPPPKSTHVQEESSPATNSKHFTLPRQRQRKWILT